MSGESTVWAGREQLFRGAIVVGIGLFVTYFVLGRWVPTSPILGFGKEDAIVEYLGALFWAIAWGVCAYRLIKGQRQPLLLLVMWMVLAFVFMGEEVSWFQRILGFGTPDAFEDINAQGEFNVHNLEGLGIGGLGVQDLFRLGFITYFLLLPMATASSRARRWLARLGYTAPDRGFLVMVWAVIAASVFLQLIGPEEARRVTVETRESYYAFSVMIYVYLYLRADPDSELEAELHSARTGA